ncbi:MAG: hypothetical protein WKG06_06985 [Segetibacter sp.]
MRQAAVLPATAIKMKERYNPYRIPYLGNEDSFFSRNKNSLSFLAFIAIGDTYLREKIYLLLQSYNILIINAIHPKAVVSKNPF